MSDLRTAAARLNPHESPGRRWAATVVSLLVVVGLTILDASWSEVISATVVVAPFLAAMFAGVRQTALVAFAAVLSALLSGIWNDNFGDPGYEVRAAIVLIGGVFSILAARTRGEATRAEALGEQLTAALSNLAEAVVVQDRDQRLVYANEAAATTLGFPSVDALLGAAPGDLVGRLRLLQRGRVAPDARAVPLLPRAARARRSRPSGCASSTARRARNAGASTRRAASWTHAASRGSW